MTDAAGPMVAADGRPLKASLNRALRRQKMRSLMLIAPLLLFIMITFIVPIGQMLFRSVENTIVSDTLPRTTASLGDWSVKSGEAPSEDVFYALTQDMVVAAEGKNHTRLGSRLNYEAPGISSLFRKSGRGVDKIGGDYGDAFVALDPAFKGSTTFADLIASPAWLEAVAEDPEDAKTRYFRVNPDIAEILPYTSDAYAAFARFYQDEGKKSPLKAKLWNTVYLALYQDLSRNGDPALEGDIGAKLTAAAAIVPDLEVEVLSEAFRKIDKDWLDPQVWTLMKRYSPKITNGYFLNSIDMQKTVDGPAWRDEDQQIYLTLFWRTLLMSVTITASCILLGYPVAWLLANLQARTANLLMIFVLLPFWTSLLVRTSAWKILLQQQGVINDILVWLGIVSDGGRLALINNATGTIIAMTHILLPFMILPLYSVMKTIPPAYLRAAKSLGATDWTAFWRVYFPQSVPGIGAGSILVFILSIGYYITPEIVGGTKGVFISNRIAYHISSSLNWGLAAALGTILLAVVMLLYWAYDRIVGIDNVKLGG
jgi:putative spermidine/putrescine transport system permease protein